MKRGGERHRRASDRDASLLERLAQNLEHISWEFRKFVEEQHTVVRHADFAGTRNRAASNETGIRDRVMRRAEWPRCRESGFGWKKARDGMDARGLQTFFEAPGRRDRWNTLRRPGFSRPRPPHYKHLVPT